MSSANPPSSHRQSVKRLTGVALAALLLVGCDETGGFTLGKPNGDSTTTVNSAVSKTVERDAEAPDVFSAAEDGLWDGRPSLGGVWVAHPDVDEPERVIIRNTANDKSVVGALFRKERDLPGPKLQISSDAATALGILAGAPAPLNVTALRRETVNEPSLAAAASDGDTTAIAPPAEISETRLDPIASASAAIDAAAPTPAPPVKPAAPAPRKVSTLKKPFVQIGIFSVEANAKRTAKQMRGAGLLPTVKRQEANGKAFWRVIVGPAQRSSELKTLLTTIKAEGFSDAYAVTN